MSLLKDRPFLILFGGWGREDTILRLQATGCQLAGVVTPKDMTPRLEHSVDRIRAAGIQVFSCGKSELPTMLRRFRQSALLSIGFPYLLPGDVLGEFHICLNVHPTLLPRYRGPTSGPYVLMQSEQESGSTVHLIDAGMDTGPIVLQRKVRLSRFDTVRSLRRKVYTIEPELVVEALALLEEPGFTPLSFDVVLAREGETAKGLKARFCRMPRGL